MALALVPAMVLGGACDIKDGGPDDLGNGTSDPGDTDGNDPGDTDGNDPGDTDPGNPDPGDTDAGGNDPGDTDPGDTDPGDTDPGDTDAGVDPGPRPDPAIPCEGSDYGAACTMDDGTEGWNYCIVVDGEQVQTPCLESSACTPGDNLDQGCIGYVCYWDGDSLELYSWEEPNCETPLVVVLDGQPIEFMPAVAASFDLSSDGSCTATDWPSAPWLALDRDGDGVIRDGRELFGSATPLAAGGFASQGFAALAELDSNRDGRIDAADRRFSELVLWSDLDDDRVGTPDELRPLPETTLASIDLGIRRQAACDAHGNCGLERADVAYRTADGTLAVGEVVDVRLACR